MGLPTNNGGHIQALTPETTQTVSVTGSSAATSAAVGTRVIRVVATVDCHVAFGASPTATTDDMLLPAGAVEYLAVEAPDVTKVAAIRADSDGTLYVTEVT